MISHLVRHIQKEWAKRPTILSTEQAPITKPSEWLLVYDPADKTFISIHPLGTSFDDGVGNSLLQRHHEVYRCLIVPQKRTHESEVSPEEM